MKWSGTSARIRIGPRCLDIVVVGVQDKGDKVGILAAPLITITRRSIVSAAMGERSCVKAFDSRTTISGEGKMDRRGSGRIVSVPVGWDALFIARNKEEPALGWVLEQGGIELGHVLNPLDPQWRKTRRIERKAYRAIADQETNVVEHVF
jgi:hypothetical protein